MSAARPTALALATLLAAALAACTGPSAERQAAIDAINAKLPQPYRDGLATERAHAQRGVLVLDVRFAQARVAQLEAKPHLRDALRIDETEAMVELCDEPALAPYLRAGGRVQRRFIDADGALFFATGLDGRDCPATPDSPTSTDTHAP